MFPTEYFSSLLCSTTKIWSTFLLILAVVFPPSSSAQQTIYIQEPQTYFEGEVGLVESPEADCQAGLVRRIAYWTGGSVTHSGFTITPGAGGQVVNSWECHFDVSMWGTLFRTISCGQELAFCPPQLSLQGREIAGVYRLGCYGFAPPSQTILTLKTAPNQNPSDPYPSGIAGKRATLDVIARVTTNGQPKAGVSVDFGVGVEPRTGGHDHHDAARPKGKISLTQGTTDANGEVKLTFTAPEVAGIHTVKASCQNCSNSPASKDIQVKVPGLVEMLPDPKAPPSYTMVGQTTNHASNHWFLPDSRVVLQKVVDTMFNTGWGAVGINDGSLAWGGLFDIKGGWTPSHHEHRSGNEVDISVTNPRLASAAQKKKTYAELCKKDNTAFSLQTLWHQDDGYPEHFHMYLDGTGLTSQAGGGPCCARYKTTRAKKDKNGNPVLDKGGNPVQETVALCEETSPR